MSNLKEKKASDANFTNITFDDIKNKLLTRIKTYYPDTYQDFNKSSFGAMMVDLMAMMSEQLGFYSQFVANENYVETSRSSYSFYSHAARAGGNIFNEYVSTGHVKVYSLAPVTTPAGTVDTKYKHTILKGAKFVTDSGAVYTSTEDAIIDLSEDSIIGSQFTPDGSGITYFTYVVEVPVVSGEERTSSVTIGEYQKFLKIEIKDTEVSEIIKVTDSSGNEYFQVENLSQDLIYRSVVDRTSMDPNVKEKLVPFPVPRRFMVEQQADRTFLIFGFGSEEELKARSVASPEEIALLRPGSNYVYDTTFDPNKLLSTNKFGVSPQNTVLNITYRASTSVNSNAPAGAINKVLSAEVVFDDETILTREKTDFIRTGITCSNEEPINGALDYSTTQEVSQTIKSFLGHQSRAVTAQDYQAVAYIMPSRFGSIKKALVTRDENDLKRNLNMFVVAQDQNGKLQTPSTSLKNNLKNWLNSYRMISDTIDIMDAKILNLGIRFEIVSNSRENTTTTLSQVRRELFDEINLSTPEIGQSFSIGEVERILNRSSKINRVKSIRLTVKNGPGYSDTRIDIANNISSDGGLLLIPEGTIWEIKNINDITGKIFQ